MFVHPLRLVLNLLLYLNAVIATITVQIGKQADIVIQVQIITIGCSRIVSCHVAFVKLLKITPNRKSCFYMVSKKVNFCDFLHELGSEFVIFFLQITP